MPTLYDALRWRSAPLPGPAALPEPALRWAEAGDGGPTALVTAGVHGDEGPWGALALRRLLDAPAGALHGRLRVVLAANPLAAQADARSAPLDGLDLNRALPGRADGSHTERLAAALAPLADDADGVVDLHGGGSWCVNAFVFRFPGGDDLAAAIGAPFVVDAPERAGTLTRHALERGARVVAVEMGGRGAGELLWADRIAAGVRRALAVLGVLEPDPDDTPPEPAVPVGATAVLRPPRGGLFVPTLREDAVGTVVPGGVELGRLLDLQTLATVHWFRSPHPRTALLLLRPHVGVLEGGAMTYVVAEPQPEGA